MHKMCALLQDWSLQYQMAVDYRIEWMRHKRHLQPTPHLQATLTNNHNQFRPQNYVLHQVYVAA